MRDNQNSSVSLYKFIKCGINKHVKCGIMKTRVDVYGYTVTTIINVIINHDSRLYFFY